MGREQMRNLEISKIGATQVNEFEYQKNQGDITEQERGGQQGKDGKRLTQAERVAQITAAAHAKVEKRRKKEGAKAGAGAAGAKEKKKKRWRWGQYHRALAGGAILGQASFC